jgi:competence protein ComFC
MGLLDFIFPKYCVNCKKYGDYLCPNCFARVSFDTKNICTVCGNPSYDGLTHPKCRGRYSASGSFTAVVFSPITKKLVYQFKYRPYLTNLASPVLVSVPITKNREKGRGYNQSEILAKKLAKKFDLKLLNCLVRVKETRSQVGLNKKERRENISGAFMLNSNPFSSVRNQTIILVDDVLTSGATMSEAAKVLKRAGAKSVWALSFAKED